MTYPILAVAVLACVAVAAAVAVRRTPRERRPRGMAVLVTAVVMMALTAVFDNLMIGAGLFSYAEDLRSGWSVGLAPVEDFAYPVAAAVGLPVLWAAVGGRRQPGEGRGWAGARQVLLSSRPVSWINTAYPFAAAYLLVDQRLTPTLVVGTVFFLVPYNLLMYGLNDVVDHLSDQRNPRKGGVEGAVLAPGLHRATLWAAGLSCLPFVVALLVLGGPASGVALAVSLAAVVAYSAPGLRFKERPVLDSVTSSVHFVSPAVVGLLIAGGTVTATAATCLAAFFAWGMASHAFGAVQDVGPDRAAGIGSVATALGAATTVRLAAGLYLLAGLIMLLAPWPAQLAGLLVLPYLANVAPYLGVTDAEADRANAGWRRFLVLNQLTGFLLTLLILWVLLRRG